MAKTNVSKEVKTTKAVAEKKVAPKSVAPKTEKKVEKKAEPKPKTDFKAIAENVEKAFKADKRVDVIADTNLEHPKSTTYQDYTNIHFFKPGTERKMFGCYIQGKNVTHFAVSLKMADMLDKDLNARVFEKSSKNKTTGEVEKKPAFIIVECPNEEIVETAKKIISAFENVPEKPAKKATKKSTEKKEEKVAK